MKVIRVHAPGPGEALVRVEAAGVNFIDVYHRKGLYPGPMPLGIGLEGAGVVEAVGPGTRDRGAGEGPGDGRAVRPGDRVTWTGVAGSYATHVVAPVDRLVPLPDAMRSIDAAAAMLQGMTAHYLTRSTVPLREGDRCLVHAAAGGVGLLLCQMARRLGARVIGTVGTEEKARLAREAGAAEVVLYRVEDFVEATRRWTDGEGVRVVYDAVGADTFARSLDSLAPRGTLVLYGQSSGPVPPFDPQVLNRKGSLFLTRPSLFHYVATREALLARAGDVLGDVASGALRLRVDRTLPLARAAEAHHALEGRETSGKIVLLPGEAA